MATTPSASRKTATMSSQAAATTNKEKKNWFSSLTRRKKSQSQQNLNETFSNNSTATTTTSNEESINNTTTLARSITNDDLSCNNNEEGMRTAGPPTSVSVGNNLSLALSPSGNEDGPEASPPDDCDGNSTFRKRKEEKNVFQRFRKKMGKRLSSLKFKQNSDEKHLDVKGVSGTQDASSEFLTSSPIREQKLVFNFPKSLENSLQKHHQQQQQQQQQEEPDLPFTHSYKRFIVKKWLDKDNRIMYKASSEMLNQVWYWGEISRRDAQKQLTNKPTGSFLVRDSETDGFQFTLSFRIVNVTLHYRLEYRDNYWHFEELQYESIVEMIEDILYRCTNDNFFCYVKVSNEMQLPFPVILRYPLSRYQSMPPLQDLCRRVIQKHSSMNEISKLPIPSQLLEYLKEKRELVFQS